MIGQAPLPLTAELAGLDTAEAEQAADLLAAAGLLLPGEPLAFVHPLIGSAVLADLGPFRRARAHRRAAALLDRDGADAASVAGHLIETRPEGEAWAAAALRAAGHDALVHGEARIAVRLLRRALTVLWRTDSTRTLGDLPPALLERTLAQFGQPGGSGPVREVLWAEERRFAGLLMRGRKVLARLGSGPLTEADLAYLHQTHGLPPDLVAELLT